MKKLKWIVVGMLLFMGVIFPITAFAEFQNEPDGFRDLKWGTRFATVSSQMNFLQTLPNNEKIYERVGDDLHIEKAKLTHIHYIFWRNKLAIVDIGVEHDSRFELRRALFEQHGRVAKYKECYLWGGDNSVVAYQWENDRVLIYSRFLWEQIQQTNRLNSF